MTKKPTRIIPGLIVIALCSMLTGNIEMYSQGNSDQLNREIHLDISSGTVKDFMDHLEKSHGILFSYDPTLIPLSRHFSIEGMDMSVQQLLDVMFTQNDIKYSFYKNMVILTQFKKYTISGFVEDEETGEKLIGANVSISSTSTGTITNTYGFFSLTVREGEFDLKVSYVGFKTGLYHIVLLKDTTVLFRLFPGMEIEEVVVKSSIPREELKNSSISLNKISVKSLEKLPSLLGEGDVMKMMEFLPGVQFGSEATSGIVVRGGSPEQNLILLDGVPIYNSNHAFGLFSVFNSDAIKDLSLIKGGFPARYGGRLSSVIDVRMKEGSTKEFHGNFNLGTIASKFTLEGPIIRDKSSFLLSARRTYIDLLLPKSNKSAEDFPGFYFYDINAKVNSRIKEKDRIYLSFYMGHDRFFEEERYKDQSTSYFDNEDKSADWGNQTVLARWNHIYSKKLFSNLSLLYSRYGLLIDVYEEDGQSDSFMSSSIVYNSGIDDISIKLDFDYYPDPAHDLKYGGSYIYHTFTPGVLRKKTEEYILQGGNKVYTPSGNVDETSRNDMVFASEFRFFLEDDFSIGEKLFSNIGLHYSGFGVDNAFYSSIEPRISTSYSITNGLAIKGAYSRMKQYLHLMTHSGMGLPTDLWLPVTAKVKPQYSNQYTLGTVFYHTDAYRFNVEGYYKTMHQIYAYREGADYLAADNSWEDNIETGKGSSYGMEFMLSKTAGKLEGWISYTYSKTLREFEELNNGEPFPYKYDRTHQVNIVSTYSITPQWSANATWIYATGMAYTLATEKYVPLLGLYNWNMPDGNSSDYIDAIESRNNARMPDYHRLDLSMSYRKDFEKITGMLNISVYNVYNRFNPYLIHWDDDVSDDSRRKQKQVALFSVIPSINLRIIF
ncbi:carboxypeptidase-like regulatory domain-containing protein [Bacteroidota bacterium]